MSSRSPRLPLGAAWLVVAAYAIVHAWLTVWPYARIAFGSDPAERAAALRDCGAAPACAPDAQRHLAAQLAAMDHVVVAVRGTAALITVLDVVLLAIVTLAVLAGRTRGAGRLLGAAWVVQAAGTVLLFILYAGLLLRGQATRAGVPRPARMPTFDASFAAPLTDAGTIYYAAWFVVMNGAVLLTLRSLGRVLRAVSPPAPGSGAPAR